MTDYLVQVIWRIDLGASLTDEFTRCSSGYVSAPFSFIQPLNRSLTKNSTKQRSGKSLSDNCQANSDGYGCGIFIRGTDSGQGGAAWSFQEIICGEITRRFGILVAEFVAASSMRVAAMSLSTMSRIVPIGARYRP